MAGRDCSKQRAGAVPHYWLQCVSGHCRRQSEPEAERKGQSAVMAELQPGSEGPGRRNGLSGAGDFYIRGGPDARMGPDAGGCC